MTAETATVSVALGSRSYDVIVGSGLIADAGHAIADRFPKAATAIVTDETVAGLHLPTLQTSLEAAGVAVRGVATVPPGEASKSMATLSQVSDELLASGLERRDLVIALGGGVIGDLAGFAAAIVRRGVAFVQIPTSLLAQVDSSVGGKTGINTAAGKNLLGAFHQPSLVLADIDALATLPDRQLRAGYAEVVKYGLLGDAAFFGWLDDHRGDIAARRADVLRKAVVRSVEMKADIVARDETEQGDRALLNLGHTFGHALEAWAGYSDRLLHGEAIAIGTCQAFRFAEAEGRCPPQTAARAAGHIKSIGLPTRIADIPGDRLPDRETLLGLMAQDKKVVGGQITLILPRAIGAAEIVRDVPKEAIAAFLDSDLRSE
ncbi:MAG: 3-dehydroquinate synthase [Pseudomonadota bacterium]